MTIAEGKSLDPSLPHPARQRVLVTGCSSGIGRALAMALEHGGYQSIASARRLESLEGLDCTAKIELDVTSDASIAAGIAAAGEIDILVNNAGITLWGPMETVPIDAARQLFDTNVFGALRMSKAVLPAMRARRSGLIVQISSAAGRSTSPLVGYYSASKHALEAASEALRLETAAFGIRVSCISLGAVVSALGEKRKNFDGEDYAQVSAHFRAKLLAKRTTPMTAEDAARSIVHILQDGGARFRYDGTEDSRRIVAHRRGLTDAQYEAELLTGLSIEPRRPPR